jgi:hypothetical protein
MEHKGKVEIQRESYETYSMTHPSKKGPWKTEKNYAVVKDPVWFQTRFCKCTSLTGINVHLLQTQYTASTVNSRDATVHKTVNSALKKRNHQSKHIDNKFATCTATAKIKNKNVFLPYYPVRYKPIPQFLRNIRWFRKLFKGRPCRSLVRRIQGKKMFIPNSLFYWKLLH